MLKVSDDQKFDNSDINLENQFVQLAHLREKWVFLNPFWNRMQNQLLLSYQPSMYGCGSIKY